MHTLIEDRDMGEILVVNLVNNGKIKKYVLMVKLFSALFGHSNGSAL